MDKKINQEMKMLFKKKKLEPGLSENEEENIIKKGEEGEEQKKINANLFNIFCKNFQKNEEKEEIDKEEEKEIQNSPFLVNISEIKNKDEIDLLNILESISSEKKKEDN